jgi:PHP family Zn ribbon phosphoesterase
VFDRLSGINDPDTFGLQVIANENDEVEGFENKLLIGAVDISIDDVVRRIHRLNGIAIAAHIDRESFGIIGHLGFIPPSVSFDALEISAAISKEDASRRFETLPRHVFIRSSDAHFPEQLGAVKTHFFLERPTCDELRSALRRENGRMASIDESPSGAE